MESGVNIYKRAANGAVLLWRQEISGSRYRTISGQRGGSLVTSAWTQCEATNEGRANERNAEAQAVFEVAANYKKKLERDYSLDESAIDTPQIFLPMLAKEYGDHKDKLDFTSLHCQPKLDGMRCIATAAGLFSRNGKPILSCPHIAADLAPFFADNPEMILDGELYNHDLKDDFNGIISAAKKLKPSAADLEQSARLIQYHVYDVPSHDGPFTARLGAMLQALGAVDIITESIRLVPTRRVDDPWALDSLYDAYLAAGYEGQMVRADSPYVNKRTAALLKRKETQSAEFEVLAIEEGLGNWAGKAKRAILRMPDGSESEAGITGTMTHCAAVLQCREKFYGKPATVEFFGYTPAGKLRFGRVKEFDRQDLTLPQ